MHGTVPQPYKSHDSDKEDVRIKVVFHVHHTIQNARTASSAILLDGMRRCLLAERSFVSSNWAIGASTAQYLETITSDNMLYLFH